MLFFESFPRISMTVVNKTLVRFSFKAENVPFSEISEKVKRWQQTGRFRDVMVILVEVSSMISLSRSFGISENSSAVFSVIQSENLFNSR